MLIGFVLVRKSPFLRYGPDPIDLSYRVRDFGGIGSKLKYGIGSKKIWDRVRAFGRIGSKREVYIAPTFPFGTIY